MNLRTALVVIVVATLSLLPACGDDATTPPAQVPPPH
jgi:hypothetical protein